MTWRARHVAAAVASVLAGCGPSDAGPPAARPIHPRALVVLGIDGMDPELTRDLLQRGELPNLAALIGEGGMSELDTANPPQSPVAWSTFITGIGPDGHGIYDFVHRDPRALAPYLSTSRTHAAGRVLELGGFALALDSPEVQLLRQGDAFWQLLERHGVPATVVKVPANYPPADSHGAESMSGMGTPDLLGTYGTFQLATDDARLLRRPLKGGIAHRLAFRGDRATSQLTGPANPTRTSGEAMALALEVVRDPERDVALLRLGDREVVLGAGEWSEWTPVAFDPGALGGEVTGMVRLYLRQVRPTFHLYISPINLDPLDAEMPLSSPGRYAAGLARDIGRFYTQGMPEDTKALASGALAPREFLSIADRVMGETEAALRRELARFRGGFLFVYLSSIDQTSHVFFRSLDPKAPPEERAFADVIPALYRRMDGWIALVRERAPPGTTLVVMSDHGFAPYRTKVHLNTFLAQRGYLATHPPGRARPGPLGHVDWSRTQAYAFGLNQVFVNLRGRESRGAVAAGERELVVDRLERDLLALRDPTSGVTAITRVERPPAGRFADRAPDLLIGYRAGFRSSDESALGQVGDELFEPNRDRWSGDHCMDPAEVPGVVASSAPLQPLGRRPGLADMAPTILTYFGIQPPAGLAGRPFLRAR